MCSIDIVHSNALTQLHVGIPIFDIVFTNQFITRAFETIGALYATEKRLYEKKIKQKLILDWNADQKCTQAEIFFVHEKSIFPNRSGKIQRSINQIGVAISYTK